MKKLFLCLLLCGASVCGADLDIESLSEEAEKIVEMDRESTRRRLELLSSSLEYMLAEATNRNCGKEDRDKTCPQFINTWAELYSFLIQPIEEQVKDEQARLDNKKLTGMMRQTTKRWNLDASHQKPE